MPSPPDPQGSETGKSAGSHWRAGWVLTAWALAISAGAGVRPMEPRGFDQAAPGRRAEEEGLLLEAFTEAWASFIDSVSYPAGDTVLFLGGRAVYFKGGKMLGAERLSEQDRFEPILYEYPLGPLLDARPAAGEPMYSTDVLESLFGRTESEIRQHGRRVPFLDRRVFMNLATLEALAAVEADIRTTAERDPELLTWLSEISVAYSFIARDVAGTDSRSYHAWGFAVDLVPNSYRNKHVYWRWSRVFNREGWANIPLDQRWSPPQAAIDVFERHGFIWGGKWSHFDTIHFEYRPDILLYNRLLARSRVGPTGATRDSPLRLRPPLAKRFPGPKRRALTTG